MSRYRITVDRNLCSGFASCVELAPGIFRLDPGGNVTAVVPETNDPAVLDAADSCPMGAIQIEEVEAA
jgi:ferredoxin